ncbi:MAG: type secretion system protein TrbI [Pseudomonadota bacterium]|nr:type secretion system protein TrbI [Pseudomonadota bacterium]
MVNLRDKIRTKGLNRKIIIVVAILSILIFLAILLYVTNWHKVKENKPAPEPQNFARNDSDASLSNIVLVHPKTSGSAPLKSDANAGIHAGMHASMNASDALNNQPQQEDPVDARGLAARMKTPLSSNMLVPPSGSTNLSSKLDSSIPRANEPSSDVLSSGLSDPVAPLVLSMGTKLPAQLDQEINSDLPGQIYGHVSHDVYDSRTHSHLLIPAGSNLVGTYDSTIAYGQERLLVAWKRVNLPNGQWINLQGMGGADPVGAGFGDKVDNHYWRIFGATFLTSVLAAGAQLSQPQQSDALQSPGVGQTLGQSVGTQIAATGTMLAQKNINIQPTIHIRSGFEFTVEVNKDMVFSTEYTANGNKG